MKLKLRAFRIVSIWDTLYKTVEKYTMKNGLESSSEYQSEAEFNCFVEKTDYYKTQSYGELFNSTDEEK